MSYAVAVAMFGWIPVGIGLFLLMPHWRAAIVGFLLAWMFLPLASYPIHGFPDYTKMSATCGVILVAVAIFDFRELLSLRPNWYDMPIMLLCVTPFFSSIANRLGVHDGLSAVFEETITWGVPYLIGRLYFDELTRVRELTLGVFIAGLVYMPLCLFEIWQGPMLHKWLYGFFSPQLDIETRFGILRPMVFMQSGLMLSVWMTVTTVIGLWLWKSGALPSKWRKLLVSLIPSLMLTTILIRSVNGWLLLALGLMLLGLSYAWPSRAYLICLVILIGCYVAARASGVWSGEQEVAAAALIHPSKGQSISYRLVNEDMLSANARDRLIFGWGRQGAALHRDDVRLVPDSYWVIVFLQSGLVGLVLVFATLLLPVMLFSSSFPPTTWTNPEVGPVAGLAVVLILYSVDLLVNAMINPVFMLMAGGLAASSTRKCNGPAVSFVCR